LSSNHVSILTDDIEEDKPILEFEKYCDTLVKMVIGSKPKFSIGIYGKWGTGKTTLMRMIEKKLKTFEKEEEFSWSDIISNNNINSESAEGNRLRSFIKDYYKLDWIENSYFQKDGNDKIILYDKNRFFEGENKPSPKSANSESIIFQKIINTFTGHSSNKNSFNKSPHSLSIKLDDKDSTAALTIDNTGGYSPFIVKKQGDKIILHYKEKDILTVWFNAWRYEREDQFALIALMKTIAYAMAELPTYQEVKRILLRGIGIIGKDVLRNLALKYAMTEKGIKELEEKLLPKTELLSKVDKETVYFDGIEKIRQEMEKIVRTTNKRIVVFIDDLDRCSPKTTLEVFESIKAFLELEGFIYIVGLSFDTISKLIDVAYKESHVKGEDYIRKIIQLPIFIPDWNDANVIRNLIENLSKRLDENYSKLVDENKDVISKAVELNPREVKRFINNFIIAREIFSGKEVKAEELLLVQALKIRWNKFYSYISTDEKFTEEVKKYAKKSEDDRREAIAKRKNDKDNPPKGYENKVFDFESDIELWDFLGNNMEIIFQIKDWKVYRHVVESLKEEKEIIRESAAVSEGETSEQLRELLKKGQITEFNNKRQRIGFLPLNLQSAYLSGVDLSGANLSGVDLSRAVLSGAVLRSTILRDADLSGANLRDAVLSGAVLRSTILSGVDLSRANLRDADLSGAILRSTILRDADLSGAILSGVDLSGAILSGVDLSGAVLSYAKNMPISKEEAKERGAIVD
jgi:uncharacterized protein YjbI with pentapeptide repeats